MNYKSENYLGNSDTPGWPNAIHSEGSIHGGLKEQHGSLEILLYSFITTFKEHLLYISLQP